MMSEFIADPAAEEVAKELAHDDMKEIADKGAEIARDDVAVDTGELQASIAVEETEEGARITVGTDHWVFVEFGTSTMAAQPFMRTVIEKLGLNR